MSQTIPETHSHPEVELWLKAAKVAKPNSQSYDGNATSLEYLEIFQGSQQFRIQKDVGSQAFARYCEGISNRSSRIPLLRAFFVKNILPPENNAGDFTAALMHQHFGIPLSFFRELKAFLSSRPMGNALFTRKDRDGNVISIDGYYQLCRDYSSDAGSFVWFSQSLLVNKPTTYVVVQAVDRAKTLIYDCATGSTAMLLRPFVIDAFLLDDSVQRMSDAMLQPRFQFLEDEWTTFDRQASTGEKVAKIKQLHRVVREFRLLRDGLVDVKETLLSLDVAQTQYSKSISPASPRLDTESVKESFALLISKSNWMVRALTSLEDRASRKIDLQYNIENQEDNQTNLKIAKLTTDIAVYTQKDSSSMITSVVMAAVTMFFLPGTFVSALFSMVFFNVDPTTDKLTSASQAWVFAAITIPLTIAVFAVWILWRKQRTKAIENDMMTRSRLQDVDIENGVVQDERSTGGLYRTAKGGEETIPLRQMSDQGAKRKLSTRR
ncbi:hypothetical protein M413DRAFT_29799 [Hebeloma cylindrosporum]|uniref:Uncharacterized protein n=1 Tax=Hebeloma cylindrosporum TaxID=76867 RepID=A0A0C2YCV0_HEBCY|nr:hypothetical protein M413DRAFT_29799 [Hebeloma cylindrosporum h7]